MGWEEGEVVLSDVGVPEATVLAYLKVKSKVCLSSRERELAVPEKLPSLQASYNWHIHHLNDSRRERFSWCRGARYVRREGLWS